MKINTSPRKLTVLLALSASVAFLTSPVLAQTATTPAPKMGMTMETGKTDNAGSKEMHKSMMSGMDTMNKMPMSGNVDKDFAMMMKVHHQQALDMAAVELANGKSPEMKEMAKNIIAAQKKEIAQFDKWLATQK
jgi:uncharacterized protein (DUF305 family)